jgi:hypothetical protein
MNYSHMPDRRWGHGHNVLLASLTKVLDDLYATSKPFLLPPAAQPINRYPVESMMLSGRVRGDGMIMHEWTWGFMPMPAFQWYMSEWFPNGEKSVPVTILERMHEWSDEYVRYNAYMIRPEPGKDYKIDGGRVVDLVQRFSALRALGDQTAFVEQFVNSQTFGAAGVYTGDLTATRLVNTQSYHNPTLATPLEPAKWSDPDTLRPPTVYNDRIAFSLFVNDNTIHPPVVAHGLDATLYVNADSFGTPVVSQ